MSASAPPHHRDGRTDRVAPHDRGNGLLEDKELALTYTVGQRQQAGGSSSVVEAEQSEPECRVAHRLRRWHFVDDWHIIDW
jgi:hypothetical protein